MGLSSSFEPNPQDYERDPVFQQRVAKLHRLTVYGRWLLISGLWLTIGWLSLWMMRDGISLMLDYFTWAALKYTLVFNPIPALGLAICVGLTVGVLLWQSRNILFGLSEPEQKRLELQVCKIAQQGKSHPLWRFVYEGRDVSP
ncbi:MAG TPA: hypothetical protein IGS53_20360 [Leptolyngbyaceae cyanobacterium M33_DOE_097]|uniref:Uncharacterized protein n=1 Tax=Oscillatoriales cyanobacterium SpSt-418 TaxID=2282169 RepID=A0A7C3PCM4_9CYAN|nr:hypothetical protein [Leptolyngbyaceae cyanobacterium M33_DOE_097]